MKPAVTAPKPTASTIEPLLLSRKDAARLLALSPRSLDYMIAGKLLQTRRIGSRVLIPMAEVRRVAREDHPFSLAG